MRDRHRTFLAVCFAGALVIATAGVATAITTISGSGTSWSPTRVSVSAGSSVKWTATSGNHRIKSWGGNWTWSRSLDAGTSRRHDFPSSGTFKFVCTIHGSVAGGVCSGMCGKVVVT